MIQKSIKMFFLAFCLMPLALTKNLYDVLGVSRNASFVYIRQVYTKHVKRYVNGKLEEFSEQRSNEYLQVQNAFDILSNLDERQLYNLKLKIKEKELEYKKDKNKDENNSGKDKSSSSDKNNGKKEADKKRDKEEKKESSSYDTRNTTNTKNMKNTHRDAESTSDKNIYSQNTNKQYQNQNKQQDTGKQDYKNVQEQYRKTDKQTRTDIYHQSNIVQLTKITMPDLQNLTRNWNIYYLNNSTASSKETQLVKSFADEYGKDIKIGIINCDKEKDLCNKQGIFKFPTFMLYYSQNRKIQIALHKGLQPSFLMEQNYDLMDNNVARIDHRNYHDFVKEKSGKHILLIFGPSKAEQLTFMLLANDLKSKIAFGRVSKTDPLLQKFNIRDTPSLLLLIDAFKYKGKIYNGKISRGSIANFLNDELYANSVTQNAISNEVSQLTKEKIKQGTCSSNDTNFCFIAIIHSENYLKSYMSVLEGLAVKYGKDSFSFYYVFQRAINTSVWKAQFDTMQTLIIKGSKQKYTGLERSLVSMNRTDIYSKIGMLLSGSFNGMKSYSTIDRLIY